MEIICHECGAPIVVKPDPNRSGAYTGKCDKPHNRYIPPTESPLKQTLAEEKKRSDLAALYD